MERLLTVSLWEYLISSKAAVPVYCLNLRQCAPGAEGHLKRLTLSPPRHSPLLRGTETRKKHLWAGSPGKHRNLSAGKGGTGEGCPHPYPSLRQRGSFTPKGIQLAQDHIALKW